MHMFKIPCHAVQGAARQDQQAKLAQQDYEKKMTMLSFYVTVHDMKLKSASGATLAVTECSALLFFVLQSRWSCACWLQTHMVNC